MNEDDGMYGRRLIHSPWPPPASLKTSIHHTTRIKFVLIHPHRKRTRLARDTARKGARKGVWERRTTFLLQFCGRPSCWLAWRLLLPTGLGLVMLGLDVVPCTWHLRQEPVSPKGEGGGKKDICGLVCGIRRKVAPKMSTPVPRLDRGDPRGREGGQS